MVLSYARDEAFPPSKTIFKSVARARSQDSEISASDRGIWPAPKARQYCLKRGKEYN